MLSFHFAAFSEHAIPGYKPHEVPCPAVVLSGIENRTSPGHVGGMAAAEDLMSFSKVCALTSQMRIPPLGLFVQ